MKIAMKGIAKTKFGSFWLILFVLVAFSFALSISEDASARCVNGYCYDTGTNASGGTCGTTQTGTWWDTCYGLSWQYYKWPTGWDDDIIMFGSDNSGGNATVAAQCKEYGGFWFLGYEAYQPSSGESKGYQIARPKASMLKDYDYGGKAPLFPFDSLASGVSGDSFTPKKNPYIPTYNSGLASLKGKKYGTAEEVQDFYEAYVLIGEARASAPSFKELNWFCSQETKPKPTPIPDPGGGGGGTGGGGDPDDPDPNPGGGGGGTGDDPGDPEPEPDPENPNPILTSYARGRSVVKASSTNWNRTAWGDTGETVRIAVEIEEGDTKDISFSHRVYAKGKLPQLVGYRVTDSTEEVLAETFIDYDGNSMDESVEVYSDTITVDQEGSYCQTLRVTYERPEPAGTQNRYSTACVDVTVTRRLPEIEMHGRMEITVGEQTLSTDWDAGMDHPVIIDTTIQEGETVDVVFNEYMKAIDGVDTDFPFDIVNSYYLGRTSRGYYKYKVDNDNNIEREVASNSVEGIGKRMTVCETMYYRSEGEDKSLQACVRVSLNKNVRTLGQPDAKTGYIDFTAQINPYISIKVGSNGLITSGGINQLLRSGTDVRITTNNMTGYTAMISSNIRSSDENATSLYNRYSKNYIPTLVSPVFKSDFPVNRWGFSFEDTEDGDDNSTYHNLKPLDAESPYVFSESDHADEKTHDVYFAAMTDINQASGTYSAGVSLRAVAGIVPNLYNSIDEIQYMQDINDNVLDSMVLNQQYQLIDQRDNKTYYVAKLADGNVWMTQNLDFELKEGDRLFEGDSDVSHRSDMTSSYLDIPNSTSHDVYEPWAETNPARRLYADTTYKAGIELPGGHSYRPLSDIVTSANFEFRLNDGTMEYRKNIGIPRTMIYGQYVTSWPSLSYCGTGNGGAGFSDEQCAHWNVGIYYSPKIAHGEAFEGSVGQTESNTICPGRWTLPTAKEFETLVSNKTVTTLLDAPYYFTSAGLYGLRNEASDFSQWYVQTQFITYVNKDGSNTISTYPVGLTADNIFNSPTFSQNTSKKAPAYEFPGLAATVRCIARRGY